MSSSEKIAEMEQLWVYCLQVSKQGTALQFTIPKQPYLRDLGDNCFNLVVARYSWLNQCNTQYIIHDDEVTFTKIQEAPTALLPGGATIKRAMMPAPPPVADCNARTTIAVDQQQLTEHHYTSPLPNMNEVQEPPATDKPRDEGTTAHCPKKSKPSSASKADKVRRPRNCFILYREYYHSKISTGALRTCQVSKIIGEMWRKEPIEVKNLWKERARKEAEAHELLHPGYRYSPRKPGEKKRRLSRKKAAVSDLAKQAAEVLDPIPPLIPEFEVSTAQKPSASISVLPLSYEKLYQNPTYLGAETFCNERGIEARLNFELLLSNAYHSFQPAGPAPSTGSANPYKEANRMDNLNANNGSLFEPSLVWN